MGKRRLLAGVAAALAVTSLALAPATAADAHGAAHQDEYKRVGYFIQWGIYGRSYFVKNLETSGQASRLTHINYAFGGVNAAGKCESVDPWADYQRPVSAAESVDGKADEAGQPLAGNFNQLRKLKAMHPGLKVLMSLGGWTLSANFSDAALTDASRQALVKSCIDTFMSTGVFDGFDLDWEWPGSEGNPGNVIRPEDKQNFTKLVAEFRKQLGKKATLTAFLPASPAKIDAGFEANQIFKYLDFGSVQGYDYHGTWETTTNQQSALFVPRNAPTTPDFSGSTSLKAWTDRGAPKKQLVLGVPYYGQGWTGVTNAKNGLFQTATGPAPGTWAAGNEDYKVLATLPQQGYKVYHDLLSGHAWLFNGTTFWTFDDPIVVAQKGLYVRLAGYGGAMIWSLDGDDANGTLTKAIYTTLR
ncbi:glycoside hydrolase family 18 protein [Dactylosporangium sp. CA-052675]|uniref:glycoside hydrolase family 18 protein n=1 Tax=Dactylosporangium sp. CA-052675 TaxID=3239927 RepID=UPI003D8B844F